MKAVVLICILLAIMISGILINDLYVRQFTADMMESLNTASSLPNEIKAQASALQERWSSDRVILQFTASRAKIEAVDDALDAFCIYADKPESPEFKKAKALLENALEKLKA